MKSILSYALTGVVLGLLIVGSASVVFALPPVATGTPAAASALNLPLQIPSRLNLPGQIPHTVTAAAVTTSAVPVTTVAYRPYRAFYGAPYYGPGVVYARPYRAYYRPYVYPARPYYPGAYLPYYGTPGVIGGPGYYYPGPYAW